MTTGLSSSIYWAVPGVLWWSLWWVGVGRAEDCPQGCHCDSVLGSVDCSYVAIQPLTTVLVSDTNMTRELYLHHSHLSQLAPDLLTPLHMLQRLDLSHNNITSLPPHLFHNTLSLLHLDLSHNNITSLPSSVFSSLTQLTQLDLSHNPLVTLLPTTFANLSRLQHLSVSHTELATLHSSYFSPCPELVSVDLAHNHITTISPTLVHTLRQLDHLRTFNVSSNPLLCGCSLLAFRDWLAETDVHTAVMCADRQDIAQLTCHPSSLNRPYHKNKPTMGPLVYNPQLGWYTGGVLLAMLFLFLVCVVLDRCKRHLIQLYKHKKRERLKLKYREERARGEAEYDADLESVASYHLTPAAVAAAFHEQYISVINQQLKHNFSEDSDNTAQRNMIDPNSLTRDKKISKQRIEELSRSVRHDIPGLSTSHHDDDDNPLTVLEVHPDCPIHSVVTSTGSPPGLPHTQCGH